MRANSFGDKYCHTAQEVRDLLDGRSDVYVSATSFDPPESHYKATCEVVENGSGETVCYIEANTLPAVHALVEELKLEVS